MISHFSDALEDFQKFEKEVCPIEKVITFTKQGMVTDNKIMHIFADKAKFLDICTASFNGVDKDGSGHIDMAEFTGLV